MSKEKETRQCGSCAFMVHENIYGYGSCAFDLSDVVCYDDKACQNHIDKDMVRHSAAILAQYKRNVHTPASKLDNVRRPKDGEIDEAIDTITRYVNVITKKV